MQITHNIRIERVLPYPQAAVWKAISDPAVLGSWFMPNDFKAEPGYEFTFQMKPQRGWDGTTHCQVIALEPPNKVAFTYRGRASAEKTLACAGIDSRDMGVGDRAAKNIFTELDTVLSFTLTPEYDCHGDEHTVLVMAHTGFEGVQLSVVGLVMDMGWRRVLKRLDAVMVEEASVGSVGLVAGA